MQEAIIYFRRMIDLVFRVRNKLRVALQATMPIPMNQKASDSEQTFYVETVERIVEDDSQYRRFRRIFDYREILEHVTFRQGSEYISRVRELCPELLMNSNAFRENDLVGHPRTYGYNEIGKFSPTTLRYISVGAELQTIFGKNFSGSIVEIGIGYGGQCAILHKIFKISKYGLYDLNAVLNLGEKYLRSVGVIGNPIRRTLADFNGESWDLAVSNYAFSELPRGLQIEYIEKVLSKSSRGYLIMNSGRTNHTGRSTGKLTLAEIVEYLPPTTILEEYPKTGSDNFVITWGQELRTTLTKS